MEAMVHLDIADNQWMHLKWTENISGELLKAVPFQSIRIIRKYQKILEIFRNLCIVSDGLSCLSLASRSLSNSCPSNYRNWPRRSVVGLQHSHKEVLDHEFVLRSPHISSKISKCRSHRRCTNLACLKLALGLPMCRDYQNTSHLSVGDKMLQAIQTTELQSFNQPWPSVDANIRPSSGLSGLHSQSFSQVDRNT